MRTAASRAEHLTVFGAQVEDVTDQLARRRATKQEGRSAQATVVWITCELALDVSVYLIACEGITTEMEVYCHGHYVR